MHTVKRKQIFEIVFVNVERFIEFEHIAFCQSDFKPFGIPHGNKLLVKRAVFYTFAAGSQLKHFFSDRKTLRCAVIPVVKFLFVNDRIISAFTQNQPGRRNSITVGQYYIKRIGNIFLPVDYHGRRFGNVKIIVIQIIGFNTVNRQLRGKNVFVVFLPRQKRNRQSCDHGDKQSR